MSIGNKVRAKLATLSTLSSMELLAGARHELADKDQDPDAFCPYLVALHQRPTREVFDAAARLTVHDQAAERELGVLILRELGDYNHAGRRPFSAEAIPLLVERLGRETDLTVLAYVISALGFNHASQALPAVLRFADHPDPRIRFHVAAALPALVNPERTEPAAQEALARLCQDEDADIRYYALHALVAELPHVESRLLARTLDSMVDDPDEQVRELANAHRG